MKNLTTLKNQADTAHRRAMEVRSERDRLNTEASRMAYSVAHAAWTTAQLAYNEAAYPRG